MMENEVHLVFSRIQHVNPNFEDQYQIQEFEGVAKFEILGEGDDSI